MLNTLTPFAAPSKIFFPVRPEGLLVKDNGGDVIAQCFTPEMAVRIATLINADAEAECGPMLHIKFA